MVVMFSLIGLHTIQLLAIRFYLEVVALVVVVLVGIGSYER